MPKLAASFGRDASVVQMTVSFYMAGIACSQLVMGPLSDKFGRRPIMLIGMVLAVVASLGCILAETLPQLIAARFFQALGAATGIVVSRAIIRDLYPRDRIGAMISLITGVMMVAQMLSPLTGGLIDAALGWHAILYIAFIAAMIITVAVALALPETRVIAPAKSAGFRGDVRDLITNRAFIGYVLCQVMASQIVFVFAGGGPYVVETLMGRSAAEYGFWFGTTAFAYLTGNVFCVRFSPRHSLDRLIWFGLALQFIGSLLNVGWSLAGPRPYARMAVRDPDAGDVRQRIRHREFGSRRHQCPSERSRHGRRRDGLPANGHRRFRLAARRLARRPFHDHLAADVSDLRDVGRGVPASMIFLVPRARRRGQRRADREGGGGRDGRGVRAYVAPYSPINCSHSSSVNTLTPCFSASLSFEPAPRSRDQIVRFLRH